MDTPDWLSAAKEDALRRGLPELVPLLEGLAVSTGALRTADAAQHPEAAPVQPEDPREG